MSRKKRRKTPPSEKRKKELKPRDAAVEQVFWPGILDGAPDPEMKEKKAPEPSEVLGVDLESVFDRVCKKLDQRYAEEGERQQEEEK